MRTCTIDVHVHTMNSVRVCDTPVFRPASRHWLFIPPGLQYFLSVDSTPFSCSYYSLINAWLPSYACGFIYHYISYSTENIACPHIRVHVHVHVHVHTLAAMTYADGISPGHHWRSSMKLINLGQKQTVGCTVFLFLTHSSYPNGGE